MRNNTRTSAGLRIRSKCDTLIRYFERSREARHKSEVAMPLTRLFLRQQLNFAHVLDPQMCYLPDDCATGSIWDLLALVHRWTCPTAGGTLQKTCSTALAATREQRRTNPRHRTTAIVLTTRFVPANRPQLNACQEMLLFLNQQCHKLLSLVFLPQ